MRSAEIKAFFEGNGYFIARGVFGADDVSGLEEDFDHIVAQLLASGEEVNARWTGAEMDRLDGQKGVVVHTHNVQQYSSRWLRALLHEPFLDVAEAILGPDIILHHTKLFQKPAELGAPFPMHQDWQYFPSLKDTMMAAVIHVSEATDEMGCLRVYPGTHQLGRVQDTSGQGESEMLRRYPIENATPLVAEPGDVVFFHYCTIHGSMPNRSNKPRKTVLVQLYAGDDEIEAGNSHPDERLALRGWNSRITRSKANV